MMMLEREGEGEGAMRNEDIRARKLELAFGTTHRREGLERVSKGLERRHAASFGCVSVMAVDGLSSVFPTFSPSLGWSV